MIVIKIHISCLYIQKKTFHEIQKKQTSHYIMISCFLLRSSNSLIPFIFVANSKVLKLNMAKYKCKIIKDFGMFNWINCKMLLFSDSLIISKRLFYNSNNTKKATNQQKY